jgi:hypothetical protein
MLTPAGKMTIRVHLIPIHLSSGRSEARRPTWTSAFRSAASTPPPVTAPRQVRSLLLDVAGGGVAAGGGLGARPRFRSVSASRVRRSPHAAPPPRRSEDQAPLSARQARAGVALAPSTTGHHLRNHVREHASIRADGNRARPQRALSARQLGWSVLLGRLERRWRVDCLVLSASSGLVGIIRFDGAPSLFCDREEMLAWMPPQRE